MSSLRCTGHCCLYELNNICSDLKLPERKEYIPEATVGRVANLGGYGTTAYVTQTAVVCFSDPTPYKYGEVLTKYIRKHKLGKISKSVGKNPLHGMREVAVWTWALDHDALKKWAEANKEKFADWFGTAAPKTTKPAAAALGGANIGGMRNW